MAKRSSDISNDQRDPLKTLASQRDLKLHELFKEFSVTASAEFKLESNFHVRALRGDKAKALATLDELDRKHKTKP